MAWQDWDDVEVLDYLTNRFLYSHHRFAIPLNPPPLPLPTDRDVVCRVLGIPLPEVQPRYWKKVSWA